MTVLAACFKKVEVERVQVRMGERLAPVVTDGGSDVPSGVVALTSPVIVKPLRLLSCSSSDSSSRSSSALGQEEGSAGNADDVQR